MLADLQFEGREYNFKGGSFHVEGLSFESFAVLVRTHLPDLEALFALFADVESLQSADLERLAIATIEQAPGFAANVIALAAGEPTAAPAAAKMPFPLQVQVLVDIAEITFSEVGGVKKFLPTVLRLLGAPEMTAVKAAMKKAT